VTEQVAQAIRDGIREGRWKKNIPGRNRLSSELGVNHKTVQSALHLLEAEGLLKSQGPGRERLIMRRGPFAPAAMHVAVLPYDRSDREAADLLEIIYRLNMSGHTATFADKSLTDLGMNVERVARFARKAEADAWVVVSAPKGILQWFADQKVPAFALYGRANDVPIASAGIQKMEALEDLLEQLFEWGHRRIVMLSHEERRKPTPGAFEQGFLDKLSRLGIRAGLYNLPDWNDDPEGLRGVLKSLFSLTPPTAIIVDDPIFFLAVAQHLSRMGITAPDQVSLACNHYSSAFSWCRPTVTHIGWDFGAAVRRVVNWTNQIGRGKNNRRKIFVPARLVLGGTTGPVPKVKSVP